MSAAQLFIAELAKAIAFGGSSALLIRAKAPDVPVPIKFLLNHPGKRDEAIVNSYGVDALIFTIQITPELQATPPEKFDAVRFDDPKLPGAPYTYALSDVITHQVNNTPVSFTAYAKGKGT